MSEEIERVARAIFEADPPSLHDTSYTWETAVGDAEYLRENSRKLARAALMVGLDTPHGALRHARQLVTQLISTATKEETSTHIVVSWTEHDANNILHTAERWDRLWGDGAW